MTDKERLDWLQDQLKGWGNGFTMIPLDGGGQYVRPWKKELESLFEPNFETGVYMWQKDIRTSIDEAILREKEGKT